MTDDRRARREARHAARTQWRLERRGRWGVEPALVVGLVLLLVGGVLLLQNTGVLDVDWGLLWPVLLILIGAVVLAGALLRPRRSPSSNGSWVASEPGSGHGSGATSLSIPADGARGLELTLRLGAGQYHLEGGAAALVDVTANEPSIESRIERTGDVTRVRLSPAVERWGWSWSGGYEWRMTVARDLPTVLAMQAGAGDFELDLLDVQLTSASISIGAAELRVILPRPHGDVPIRVEGGAAQMTFQVPPGVEARVSTTGLLTTSGRPETPGYAAAADRVTVSVTGGIAAVRVI
jgi:hypothetical protein